MLGRGFRVALVAALVVAEWLVAGPVSVVHAAGTPAPGYAVTDFATGFGCSFYLCIGPVGVTFGPAGDLYVTDYPDGQLFKFGSSGGVADSSHLLNSSLGTGAAGLAFSKDGQHFYLAQQWQHQVLEYHLDTNTTTPAGPSLDSPTGLAVDPLTGDLFTGAGGVVWRLSNLQSGAAATAVVYANVGVDGLTFAPDGTLYAAGSGNIYRIQGTSSPNPGQWAVIAKVPFADGIALVAPAPGSPITQLAVNTNYGIITLVDFSVQPVTYTDIVSNGSRGDFVAVGPDKCLYATQSDSIEKVTAADGSCPFLPTGVSKPKPNPPQNVTNIGTSAGNVLVAWQPPVPNGSVLDHYNVIEMAFGGQPRGVVATLPATATDLSSIIQNLNLCTYYTFGVSAVGSDGQESTIALPAKQAFTQGSPKSPPTTVAILVAGINTSSRAGTFNPLNVFDYCTTLDGVNPNSARTSYPAPLADMNIEWNEEGSTGHTPGFGAGNRLIDTIASKGAVVLPFSYTRATLSGPANAPTFRYDAYSETKVDNTFPDAAAATLDAEIASIHNVWRDAKIVVIGHSNGGLVSEFWWVQQGSKDPKGVVQVFSLDSPLNGVANTLCNLNICGIPGKPGVGKNVNTFYRVLWDNQALFDPAYVALDVKTDLFTPIGTVGDPVYDFGDGAVGPGHNGLLSQLYFTEPSCVDSGFNLSSSNCSLVGKDFLDPCGPLDDSSGPFFGLTGSEWLHGVVKNCPGVIAKVMTYVS